MKWMFFVLCWVWRRVMISCGVKYRNLRFCQCWRYRVKCTKFLHLVVWDVEVIISVMCPLEYDINVTHWDPAARGTILTVIIFGYFTSILAGFSYTQNCLLDPPHLLSTQITLQMNAIRRRMKWKVAACHVCHVLTVALAPPVSATCYPLAVIIL